MSAHPPTPAIQTLSEHLQVFSGAIQVGVIRDGNRALLIDCGDGAIAAAPNGVNPASVARILFTHHHRDQACGADRFPGARIGVPAPERAWSKPRRLLGRPPAALAPLLLPPAPVDADPAAACG